MSAEAVIKIMEVILKFSWSTKSSTYRRVDNLSITDKNLSIFTYIFEIYSKNINYYSF